MLSISELPRKDGIVTGKFLARHRSESFSEEGFGFEFRAGVTVEPVAQRVHERLHQAWGSDISFEPADQESADLALAWLVDRGHPAPRFDELAATFDARFAPPKPAKLDDVLDTLPVSSVTVHRLDGASEKIEGRIGHFETDQAPAPKGGKRK
jgi:hypothetical protein